MSKKYIIGIDLGTTNSAIALYENETPVVLVNLNGARTTPSIIALKKTKNKQTGDVSSEWLVGENAKRQAVSNPLNTLYGVKRLIGRRFDDTEVQKMKSLAGYKIVAGPNGDAWVEVDGKPMAPAEISAKVLRELKTAAEKYLGTDENGQQIEVTEAVITVPAYFNDAQRKATRDAGAIAGLDVKRIINEPTAAALAYGMDKKKGGKIAVYDLGGGTFDVSILEVMIDEKEGSMIQVLSTNGDTFLGGENFDERIIEHLLDVARDEFNLDLRANKNMGTMQRLKEAAEKAKIELSLQQISTVNIPFLGQNDDGEMVNFEYSLTRQKLEQLVQDLVIKTTDPCKQALMDAGLSASDIDEVILVGGQTRMPKVVETVKAFFGKEPRQDVNPDEIVAMGASVQGAIIDGAVDNVLLMDVIPLSIGLRTPGDIMDVMIARNTPIPHRKSEIFSTAADNQRNVHIKVFQGERTKTTENKFLGEFTLDGIPPAPKGKPQIEVTFDIDADGVLKVEAKDMLTGRAQKITIKANGGLSADDVERMLKDAEKNAEADRLFKEQQIALLNAESEVTEAKADEDQDYFKQAPDALKEAFFAAVQGLSEASQKKDAPSALLHTRNLHEARSAIGKAFYEAAEKNAAEVVGNDKTPAPEGEDTAPGSSGPAAP